jgi:hypothetical protein
MSIFDKSTELIRMADSASVGGLPGGWAAYAGYVNGAYQSYWDIAREYAGKAHLLSIAVNVDAIAACLDVEKEDAVPSQAPGWVRAVAAHGQWRPCIYANLSTMPQVIEAMNAAGIPRADYRLWVADQNGVAHIPEGYDGCQYDGSARVSSLTYDSSILLPNFFEVVAPKPPTPYEKYHIGRFYDKMFDTTKGPFNERKVVEEYDGARKHNIKYRIYLHRTLRPHLKALADRIAEVTLYEHKNGKRVKRDNPDWNKFNRGWRYQELLARSKGKKIVK